MCDMDDIVKRLLESRETDNLDTEYFDMKPNSKESHELLEILLNKVQGALVKFGMDDVDIDDSGLDSSYNKNITFRAQLYRFKNEKMLPLAMKEKSSIVHHLHKTVVLPKSDEKYEYSVKIEFIDTELFIYLLRNKSL